MRARSAAVGAAVALTAVALTACSSGDDAAPGTTLDESGSTRTVAVPPERLSPFCEAIHDLNERLDAAAPDADTGQLIIDTYSSIVDDVPAEIRDDFLSVLAALQAEPSGSAQTTTTTASTLPQSTTVTTLEDFEEGYTPDDDAALRLNAYLASACTDTQNNPGPSDTEPAPPPIASTTLP